MAFSAEKKVGFFFILALLIFAVMMELGEKWNPFEKKITYKTYLSSITGLKIGDSVRLAGVDVGKIDDIKVLENKVEINFEVKKGTAIKTDTLASIRMNSLLGGQFLGLSFGSPGAALLPSGGVVKGKETANIDQIVENVGDLTKDAKVLITDLNKNQNEVIGKISTILDENRANLRNTVANLDSITAKFDRGEGSLAMLLNDKRLYNNTNEVTANLKSITGKINRGEGTIGKLVNDDAFYNDAKVAMKDFKDITGKINKGQGTVGKLINDDSLYGEFKDATKNVKEITQKINSGQGTLGKLVNDDKLYYDATATLKKTEKAVEGLGDTGPISVLGSVVGTLF
ncbi:MAG TPA: MlaD family protein [Geobacteraceae bacterium]|nr:MlaD family protein [Geobacteraceae bacterium]